MTVELGAVAHECIKERLNNAVAVHLSADGCTHYGNGYLGVTASVLRKEHADFVSGQLFIELACILCAGRTLEEQIQEIPVFRTRAADPMEILGGSAVQMWNSHKQHFPLLFPLAAYVLRIPGSSEAERSFSKSKSRCAYLETQLDPANFQRRLLIALNYMPFKEKFLACATNTRKSNTE